MKTLQIFGDSILKGVYWDDAQHRYRALRECPFPQAEAHGIRIINHSRMGATIRTGLELLKRQNPDPESVILLEYGGNDCDFDWKSVSAAPAGTHLPAVSMEEYQAGLRAAIGIAGRLAGAVAVCTLFPLSPQRFMDWISQGCSRENILQWLGGDSCILYRWQEWYNQAAVRIAMEEGCLLCDIRSFFLTDHHYPEHVCADGIHPTPEAHALLRAVLDDSLLRQVHPASADPVIDKEAAPGV